MTELSDQTLLTFWYRHRNAEAFHVLASRHARMVYATALRVLRDAQAAEDVSQESFLALAQAKRPPSRNVAAWLHRTAYRAALDVIRSRKRRDARDLEYSQAQPGAAHIAWDDIRELVDEAVSALPEAQREPLVRYFFEQESHAAIAAALGIPRQTVTHRIGKGVEAVRRHLRGRGVVAPAGAALAALIQENSAVALPPGVSVELGRIALVATPSVWAVAGVILGGAGVKVAAALVLAALIAGGIAGAVRGTGGSEGVVSADAAIHAGTTPAPTARAAVPNASPEAEDDALQLERVTLAKAETPAATEVVGPAVASVSGRVTLRDGRPFSGARVLLAPKRDINAAAIIPPPPDDPAAQQRFIAMNQSFKAESDSDGNYTIVDVRPGSYRLVLSEPAEDELVLGNEYGSITLAAGEAKTGVDLQHGTEGELEVSGVVVDSAGNPIPDIWVRGSGAIKRVARTGSDGAFVLRYFPEGPVSLFANDRARIERQDPPDPAADPPAYYGEPLTVRAGTRDVRYVLNKYVTASGRVIDVSSRQPISEYVALSIPGHVSTLGFSLGVRGRTVRDPEGRFQFGNLKAGDSTIIAQAPGYSAKLLLVSAAEGEALEGLELALERTQRVLEGTVETADGQPIAGARIYLEDVPSIPRRELGIAGQTDGEGRFRIENVSELIAFLGAWHPGFAPGGAEPGEPTRIVLRKAGAVHVRVTSGGEPVSEARVFANALGAPGERFTYTESRAQTGADGRGTLMELAPGRVEIRVSATRERRRQLEIELAEGEEKTLEVDFAPADAVLEGTVMADGEPVAEGSVIVLVESATGREILQGLVGVDGTFRIAEVPAGTAELEFRPAGAGRVRIEGVALIAGETTTVPVDATMRGRIEGTLGGVAPGEKALVGVARGALDMEDMVALDEPLGRSHESLEIVYIDDTGDYSIPIHEPGVHTLLVATYRDGEHWRRTYHEARVVEVPEGEALEVNIELPNQG